MIDLKSGSALVYCETSSLARLKAKHPTDPQVAAADAAWQAAVRGEADLVQRRTDKGFEYVAIGRHRIDRRPVLPVLPSQGVRAA